MEENIPCVYFKSDGDTDISLGHLIWIWGVGMSKPIFQVYCEQDYWSEKVINQSSFFVDKVHTI